MHCPSCGAQGAAEKKFCGDCGAPLPWICGACGGKNSADKRFCGDCGTVAHGPPRLPGPQAIAVAERRPLTVMSADLVGATALGSRLDPEDMRAVIASFRSAITGLILRFDGFVARYTGDGVLA
jgi:Double zinc ribbon